MLSPPTATPPSERVTLNLVAHKSHCVKFGLTRTYALPPDVRPTHDPEQIATARGADSQPTPAYGPFQNRTAFLLAEWYWTSTSKSFLDFQRLVSIMKCGDFSLDDAINVNWRSAFKELGAHKTELGEGSSSWTSDDDWLSAPISIDIPFRDNKKNSARIRSFLVGTFRYRSIISVIKEKVSNLADSRQFHYHPYTATWSRTPDSPEVELYGELYTSRAFREEHERVLRQPSTLHNEGVERVVVALMFWSDGTQLTSFGGASLWPCYLFFGNESKYRRGKPSAKLGHQIAYFMKVANFQRLALDDGSDKLPIFSSPTG